MAHLKSDLPFYSMEITPSVKLLTSLESASNIPGSISNHFVQSSLSRPVSPHRQTAENPKKRIFFSAFNRFSRFPTETYTTTKTGKDICATITDCSVNCSQNDFSDNYHGKEHRRQFFCCVVHT